MRAAIYCFLIFLIRGIKELYNTKRSDFKIEHDAEGVMCVR
jgi:hypothetical protein